MYISVFGGAQDWAIKPDYLIYILLFWDTHLVWKYKGNLLEKKWNWVLSKRHGILKRLDHRNILFALQYSYIFRNISGTLSLRIHTGFGLFTQFSILKYNLTTSRNNSKEAEYGNWTYFRSNSWQLPFNCQSSYFTST